LAPSEIWMIGSNGTDPHRVVEDGNFPTFSADGKKIYFERQRKKTMVFDLVTKTQQEMFPAENQAFKKYQVVKPRLSSDEQVIVFTSDTPNRWNAWYADIKTGESYRIQSGCEPVPIDPGRKIAFIGNIGAKERSGIYLFDIASKSVSKLEDAAAPRGHEYFPTLVSGGRYLLYCASRPGEHSHETANYQVYVKDLTADKRVRITFDAYTNRWPKLLPDCASN